MAASPTRALAKGVASSAKLRITAPFITVGRAPARSRIQPSIPVTVDFPLVPPMPKIGRASCRERVCQYVSIEVVAVYLKKKTDNNQYIDNPNTSNPRNHEIIKSTNKGQN